jgi:ribosome-associated protein
MLILTKDLHVPDAELHFSFSRSSGPGGQNVNKVNSKAELRWKPLLRNQQLCREKLRQMLLSIARPPKKRIASKPGATVKQRRKEAKQRQSRKKRQRSGKDWSG